MICPYFTEPQFFLYVPDLPVLLYYAHIPAAVIALLLGIFVLASDRKALANRLLFGLCISFSLWSMSTLILWTNIHSDFLLFVWSLLGPIAVFISVFSIYFTYAFLDRKDVGVWVKGIFVALLAPIIALAPTEYTLRGFNLSVCDAFGYEGFMNTVYYPAVGGLAILWVFALLVSKYRKAAPEMRRQIVIMGTGIELFLLSFFTTSFLGAYLTTAGFLPDSQIETYGYFGMIAFVVYISILIVRFKSFHTNLIATQALVVALVILIASQLTYVRTTTSIVLTAITLVLTLIAGIALIRSVNREIEQRKRIEALAKDLEKANKQQVTLIHFITHQIKGFVTKSRNIFSVIREGDLGPVPETMRSMIDEGFRSDTKGVATIQEILNAANIKSGKVEYKTEPFDLKALVDETASDLKAAADAKGLTLSIDTGAAPLMYPGDKGQLVNALKNLIDNSIKYTPKGEVRVKLSQEGALVRFVVEDDGVGITPEDMAHLFTEGGHGANSTKINVESTGFGLYIVKNIIEAHDGKVWAESEGEGKGSRFVVELPV